MRLLLLFAALLALPAVAQDTGTLAGRVTDAATGEALPTAQVVIVGTDLGAATDLEGRYRIIGVPVGEYEVEARFVGFETETVLGVQVSSGYATQQDFELAEDLTIVECCLGCYWGPPIISTDPFASRTLTGEEIQRLPVER